ncbi:MAG: hypothetical protein J0I93_06525 [Legionella sp.]|nr:hypothetical protein [Legionella sp.]
MTLAILIIFMAVLSSIFRSLTPWAKQYKTEVEQHLSTLLGQPVTIQTMETGWYWFQPMLQLHQVTLGADSQKIFRLNKLIVGINLFKSLWNWEILPGVLYIDDMHLTFRQRGEHWTIDGISTDSINSEDMTPERTRQILSWLSQQERLIIRHVSAYFYFNSGSIIPVNGLNVSILNQNGRYKIKGSARLEQTSSTDFQLLGDGYFNPEHFDEIEGKFYFSAQNIVPAQWQYFIPKNKVSLEGGKGNLELWMDIHRGAVTSMHAQIELKRLAWRTMDNQKMRLVNYFFANLFWRPDSEGWELSADQIHLRLGNSDWPENQLQIKFNREQQSYRIFVKNLLLNSLIPQLKDINILQPLSALNPQGQLQDTQILLVTQADSFQIPAIAPLFHLPNPAEPLSEAHNLWSSRNEITYLLSRFNNLGWEADAKDSIPKVNNLSGAIHWQPHEGRLELDSTDTNIALKNYPNQMFSQINGSLDWKELSDGYRVSVEHILLNQPELTLSAQGILDQVQPNSWGNMRFSVEYSGKNLQKWAKFLPKDKLKPKLYFWLTKDLRQVEEFSGTVNFNGFVKDFPFDQGQGNFTINSHLNGGTITINPQWKPIQEIDADLTLDNRNLKIDIKRANFQGVPAQDIHLKIDDIGHDRENLIIEGKISGEAQKMLNYVLSSPLRLKLSQLQQLFIEGAAQLQLLVQVPLYPENDKILVTGNIGFNENILNLKYPIAKLKLEGLTGTLFFNEEGVANSFLTASSLGHSLKIDIKTTQHPVPATQIVIAGIWTADSLKQQFNIPYLTSLNGSFPMEADLTLAYRPQDSDRLTISSSLKGLSINLPAPLNKKPEDEVPFDLAVEMKKNNTILLRSNYEKRLSTNLVYKSSGKSITFDSGIIQLGDKPAAAPDTPGLSVNGSLKGFRFDEWKNIYQKYAPTVNAQSTVHLPPIKINVLLDEMSIFQQQWNNLHLKAKILPFHSGDFMITQKNIRGTFRYNGVKNQLNGHLSYLKLKPQTPINAATTQEPDLKPAEFPELNLLIDDLNIESIHIGSVQLTGKRAQQNWVLEHARIDSPHYHVDMNGRWSQQKNQDKTQIHLKMNINNLSDSLAQWQISPVVDAKKGYLEFQGGWNDRLERFTLKKAYGDLFVQLKNGRITHLNKETEEKIDLGKLLSLLSLQTIPRRLQLDFSDLASQGYSFDIFQGTFKINKGIMTTTDSYLDGPVAYAAMNGDLDLIKRTYNLNLKIAPHITASLPLVATIAGGPVAGVATWVATKIINQGMQKISSYSYKISGPWNQPVVQQLSIIQKKNEMHNPGVLKTDPNINPDD